MTPEPSFWAACLKEIERKVTQQTYSAWFRQTSARLEDGIVVIYTPSAYGLDWLENRMRPIIRQAIEHICGQDLEFCFRLQEESGYQAELVLIAEHRDEYNEIAQPSRQHYTSWYFHRAWMPLLGPVAFALIWEARTRCYWNKKEGVKRDTFEATYDELAAAIGVSVSTVKRLINYSDEPLKTYIGMFLTKVKTKRRASRNWPGTVNEKTIWKVQLEDPLTPEDQVEYERIIAAKKQQ
ncbi:MAG: hypothetical protein L6R45_10455 [Anaerolineae bacterium]|nr:hypothetical protein [Anaerolineae bacterium]